MKNRSILYIAIAALLVYSCKTPTADTGGDITISPEAGAVYKAGDAIDVQLRFNAPVKLDSVVYLLDSVKLASKTDSSALNIKTDSLGLGARLITAKIYKGGTNQDISTNIVLMAAKAPEEYTYKVDKVYPHDTSAYTEGFLYKDGFIYESTGNKGHSEIRKVDLETGKVVQRQKLDDKYFGEGSVIVGDKIVMFTYREKVGFVFDKNTLKPISQFNNNVGVEGWGATFDGNHIYLDDSTNRIWLLDKNDYHQTGFIDVYDNRGPVEQINELEYINGKIYSNIYTYDTIIIIDPKTGAVLQKVDMSNLWPKSQHPKSYTQTDEDNNVLNGIAWDEKGKRLLVTGKKWPHIYQISLVKK